MISDQIVASSIALLAAAVGWFVAARVNYLYQQRLETEREQRAAVSKKRILIADVRVIAMLLQPWLLSFTEIRLDDLIEVYQTFASDLRDKDLASALSATEFEALFALLDRFGRDTAHEQRLFSRLPERGADGHTQWQSADEERDWRQQVQANFSTTLPHLKAAGKALGDTTILEQAERLVGLLRMSEGINPYLQRSLEPDDGAENQ